MAIIDATGNNSSEVFHSAGRALARAQYDDAITLLKSDQKLGEMGTGMKAGIVEELLEQEFIAGTAKSRLDKLKNIRELLNDESEVDTNEIYLSLRKKYRNPTNPFST